MIPPSDAVITNIIAAADALYVQKLDSGLGRLWRLPFDGTAASEVELPFEGAIQERGGVIAVAHVRGGGEYGEDWHDAGRKATKKNTITDFIAGAQYLIDHGYTSQKHLAGEGTSAGGITIGGAITERPDLFAAALDNVGMSDDLRAELQINGPANIPEFGTVKNEAEFRDLLTISAYHRLKDRTAYTAVLLTTGVNDPRVDPWQMNKMTARLRAASSSGRPVLLRVDYDAGHGGIGATRTQHTALLTDQFSFLLWQLGDPEFQTSH
ncbi:MAG TPA: prolyl oligopeptidase family serine peptidase [Terriglobales bacterium]|nr:prolyl oligopeptidase family serine peptidase [Terriglobales bacterium]